MKSKIFEVANMIVCLAIAIFLYSWAITFLPSIGGFNVFYVLIGLGVGRFFEDFKKDFRGVPKFKHCFIAALVSPFWMILRKPVLKRI